MRKRLHEVTLLKIGEPTGMGTVNRNEFPESAAANFFLRILSNPLVITTTDVLMTFNFGLIHINEKCINENTCINGDFFKKMGKIIFLQSPYCVSDARSGSPVTATYGSVCATGPEQPYSISVGGRNGLEKIFFLCGLICNIQPGFSVFGNIMKMI